MLFYRKLFDADENVRAENLSLEDFAEITNRILVDEEKEVEK